MDEHEYRERMAGVRRLYDSLDHHDFSVVFAGDASAEALFRAAEALRSVGGDSALVWLFARENDADQKIGSITEERWRERRAGWRLLRTHLMALESDNAADTNIDRNG